MKNFMAFLVLVAVLIVMHLNRWGSLTSVQKLQGENPLRIQVIGGEVSSPPSFPVRVVEHVERDPDGIPLGKFFVYTLETDPELLFWLKDDFLYFSLDEADETVFFFSISDNKGSHVVVGERNQAFIVVNTDGQVRLIHQNR